MKMEVYVLLQWFYEGDSNLVDSFMGVFSSYENAFDEIPEDGKLLSKEDFIDFDIPKDWGGYGAESKYEIRKCII